MDNPLQSIAKKPVVLAVGLALGVGLLILASRGNNGGASNAAVTLQSQAIASGANVALSGQTTQYNMAALNYQTALAGNAVAMHATDVNAVTAIELNALSNLQNLGVVDMQETMQRQAIKGSIEINAANNAAYLDMAHLQAATAITLAPVQAAMNENLARIAGSNAVALANVNASTAITLGQINANSRQQIASTQQGTALGGALINNIPGIIGAASNAGLFDSLGEAGVALAFA